MCLDLHGLSETKTSKSLKGEFEVLVCEDTDQGFVGAILENLMWQSDCKLCMALDKLQRGSQSVHEVS